MIKVKQGLEGALAFLPTFDRAVNFVYCDAEYDEFEPWQHISDGNLEIYIFTKGKEYRTYTIYMED